MRGVSGVDGSNDQRNCFFISNFSLTVFDDDKFIIL